MKRLLAEKNRRASWDEECIKTHGSVKSAKDRKYNGAVNLLTILLYPWDRTDIASVQHSRGID